MLSGHLLILNISPCLQDNFRRAFPHACDDATFWCQAVPNSFRKKSIELEITQANIKNLNASFIYTKVRIVSCDVNQVEV